VRLIEVNKGTVEDIINESGIIELGEQQILKAPVEGTVAQVLVKVGDRLKANQQLVLLEDSQQQNSLSEYQLKLQEAHLDLESSRQKVEKEKKALAVVQKKLRADQKLFDRGFISQEELQNQKDRVGNAKATLAEAEQAVRRAMLQLQLLQLQGQQLEEQFQQNVVVAPGDSKVLEVTVQRGDVVERGDPLLTIGNPNQELVKLELSTLNARKVELNLPTRINIIGPSSATFSGRVKSLSLIAKTAGSQNQPTVSAIVELDRPSGKLIPGSQVSVDIILEQYQDVVVLPTQTIQRTGEGAFVWLQDEEGKAQKQPVTLGMEGITTIAIKSGLQPGDRVILPLENIPLKPGMAVRQ
jgi:HlyD family secretion protein